MLKELIILFNRSQKKSVLVDEDATLINAGAGSGKTTTILHKIIHLLEKKLCKGNEILILAYNKSVEEELKKKIKSIKNINIKDEIKELPENNIFTFHAFGLKQLKNKKVSKYYKTVTDSEKEFEEKKITRRLKDPLNLWNYTPLNEAKRIAGILRLRILNN